MHAHTFSHSIITSHPIKSGRICLWCVRSQTCGNGLRRGTDHGLRRGADNGLRRETGRDRFWRGDDWFWWLRWRRRCQAGRDNGFRGGRDDWLRRIWWRRTCGGDDGAGVVGNFWGIRRAEEEAQQQRATLKTLAFQRAGGKLLTSLCVVGACAINNLTRVT
jgi:hypothetical protein